MLPFDAWMRMAYMQQIPIDSLITWLLLAFVAGIIVGRKLWK